MGKKDDLPGDASATEKNSKKKKKDKKKKDDDENGSEDEGAEKIEVKEKSSKKKKKKDKDKKKKDGGSSGSEGNSDEGEDVKEKKKKKKKKKEEDAEEDLAEAVAEISLESPAEKEDNAFGEPADSSVDCEKNSVEYFEAMLEKFRILCHHKLKLQSKDKEAFCMTCKNYYEPWKTRREIEEKVIEVLEEEKPTRETKNIVKAHLEYTKELDATLKKRGKWCIKSALNVFRGLKEGALPGIEHELVKGAIIAQATPQKLADFVSQAEANEKLLKYLFDDPELMKEMILHGGASGYEYGEATRIYMECMRIQMNSNDDAKWNELHRKIALACALELASPLYEFDTTIRVDPVARYEHFVEAHRAGGLDPAFPFFSVWEMRQIVNCDAPNEQMKWCRQTVMNYAPHVTILTDFTQRYLYLLHSDVRVRKPDWNASPRTYQMILSGGGNESINSWFGRFIWKSFGLPSWGSKYGRKEGFTIWTPDGWKTMNGASWKTDSWQGKTAKDFKTESEARNKAPEEEYFQKLVTLQCLADILDGDPNSIPKGEKDVLHPDRMWRSMAIVSMELLFQTEPEVPRTFHRSGEGFVVTHSEKYLEKYHEDNPDDEIAYDDTSGKLIIPANNYDSFGGSVVFNESYAEGKQVNFVANGFVEYAIPDDIPNRLYTLNLEVCTVSSKQKPLTAVVADDDEKTYNIQIPYTEGRWQYTDGHPVKLERGTTIRFSRPNGSVGVAIKKFVFYPV